MHFLKARPAAAAVIVTLALLAAIFSPLLAKQTSVAYAAPNSSCIEPGWVTYANTGWVTVAGGRYQIQTQLDKLIDSANGLYCGQVRSLSRFHNINGGDTLLTCGGGISYTEVLRSSTVLAKQCATGSTFYLGNGGTYSLSITSNVASGTCSIRSQMAWGQLAASTQTAQICL